jgi:hypothetical protein
MLAKRDIPARLFSRLSPANRQQHHQYRSRSRQGASPNPVTQNSPFRIWEVISIQIRREEYRSVQDGWHMAGAALQISRNSIPPQATMFSP